VHSLPRARINYQETIILKWKTSGKYGLDGGELFKRKFIMSLGTLKKLSHPNQVNDIES
jgi:hypothetical protein